MSTNQNNFRVHAFAVQNALQPGSVGGPDVAAGVTVLFNGSVGFIPNGWTGPINNTGLPPQSPPYIWIQKL